MDEALHVLCVDDDLVVTTLLGSTVTVDVRVQFVASKQNVARKQKVEAALGQGRVLVHVYEGSVLEEFDAALRKIAASARTEVVDGVLHALPVDKTGTEGKVLGPAAVYTGNVGAHHAVQSHGLEPSDNVAKGRTGLCRTSVSSTGERSQSSNSQGRSSNSSGNVLHSGG